MPVTLSSRTYGVFTRKPAISRSAAIDLFVEQLAHFVELLPLPRVASPQVPTARRAVPAHATMRSIVRV